MNAQESRNRSAAASKSMTRVAESNRCPSCGRGSALGRRVEFGSVKDGTYEGFAQKCRYCGHEVGVLYGEHFGEKS